jgi:hypothetical protein
VDGTREDTIHLITTISHPAYSHSHYFTSHRTSSHLTFPRPYTPIPSAVTQSSWRNHIHVFYHSQHLPIYKPYTMCFYHAYSHVCGHTEMVLQQLCGKGQMKQQKCARGQDGTILATVKVETPCGVCPGKVCRTMPRRIGVGRVLTS